MFSFTALLIAGKHLCSLHWNWFSTPPATGDWHVCMGRRRRRGDHISEWFSVEAIDYRMVRYASTIRRRHHSFACTEKLLQTRYWADQRHSRVCNGRCTTHSYKRWCNRMESTQKWWMWGGDFFIFGGVFLKRNNYSWFHAHAASLSLFLWTRTDVVTRGRLLISELRFDWRVSGASTVLRNSTPCSDIRIILLNK